MIKIWQSNLNRYLTALVFSTFGIWTMRIGIGWSAWEVSQSTFWTSAISSVTLIPTIFMTPMFGVLADRIRLRIALPAVVSLLVIVSAALAILGAIDALNRNLLLGMAVIFGIASAIYHPFRITVSGRLASKTPLPRIISLTSIIFNASGILGPALAGAILSFSGSSMLFALVALMYVGYLVVFRTLRFKPREKPKPFEGFFSEFRMGAKVALSLPELLAASATVLAVGLIGRSVSVMLPVITGELLQGDASLFAGLVTISGVGAIIAGLIMSWMATDQGTIRRNLFVAAFVSMGVSALFGGLQAYGAFLAASMMLGFCMTVVGASSQSLLQVAVPDEYRGRVMSFWSMAAFGGPAIGSLALGAFGEALGLRPTLVVSGILGALVLIFVVITDRKRRADVASVESEITKEGGSL